MQPPVNAGMEMPLNLMHMPWPALDPDASLLKTAKLCKILQSCQDCIKLCLAGTKDRCPGIYWVTASIMPKRVGFSVLFASVFDKSLL